MQKYVIVNFFEQIGEGTEFSAKNWPLHLTIAPNFTVDWAETGLHEKLSNLLATQGPIETVAESDEYFGMQNNIRVTTLNMNAELVLLHNNVIQLLKSVSAEFDEPQFIEDGYRAHVTVQQNSRVNKDDKITIDDITIVDMFPHEDITKRKALQTIKLSG